MLLFFFSLSPFLSLFLYLTLSLPNFPSLLLFLIAFFFFSFLKFFYLSTSVSSFNQFSPNIITAVLVTVIKPIRAKRVFIVIVNFIIVIRSNCALQNEMNQSKHNTRTKTIIIINKATIIIINKATIITTTKYRYNNLVLH